MITNDQELDQIHASRPLKNEKIHRNNMKSSIQVKKFTWEKKWQMNKKRYKYTTRNLLMNGQI